MKIQPTCQPLKSIYYLVSKSQQKEVKKDYEPTIQRIFTKFKKK